MASPLSSAIKKQVASALKGQLLTCTLRRNAISGVDDYGVPVAGSASTWTFDGFRDKFTLEFAQAAGVPVTDARILVVRGSAGIADALPLQQDDQVLIRDQWLQLRKKVAHDPADATEEWAGFEITDPT